jgi:hypothetical protein
MDEKTAALVTEGLKVIIQSYFSYLSVTGLTEEESEAVFQKERAKFLARNPEDLPNPDKL